MAQCGRGNKAVDTLPPELRAEIDARLDMGASASELFVEVIQPYQQGLDADERMAARTVQDYATQRRRERQQQIARDEAAVFRSMLGLAGIDKEGLSDLERIQLGVAVHAMMLSPKPTSRLNAIKAVAIIQEGQRRQESHEWKKRLEQVKTELGRKADEREKAGGERVVSIEEVARILGAVDLGEKAA